MNNNKSWIDLKSFVVNSINFGSLLGELSVTQKQGIITCLPKDNKPRHFLKKNLKNSVEKPSDPGDLLLFIFCKTLLASFTVISPSKLNCSSKDNLLKFKSFKSLSKSPCKPSLHAIFRE
jgi:hypothetical protein